MVKRVVIAVCLLALFGVPALQTASAQSTNVTYTYTYSGYAVPIPRDSANVAAVLQVVFPRALTITKVTATVQVTYPGVGDLNVFMFSPAGTRAKLLERNCGSLQNIDTTFDDASQTKYADFCPAEAGRGPFQGNEALANYNGQKSLGTWRLAVENNGSDSTSGFAVSFSLTVTGTPSNTAALAPEGARNSASPFISGRPIAPGEFISVFGLNLGPPDGATTDQNYWPTWIDGTVIRINDVDCPMRFISYYRIDVQVPYNLDLTHDAQISAFRNGVATNTITVPVAATSPGIFTKDLIGFGIAYAFNEDGNQNDAAHPAKRGGLITLHASGLGVTNPMASEGQPQQVEPSHTPVAQVWVAIGGGPADVQSVRLAPGMTGMYEIVVRVPQQALAGTPADVVVSAGNSSSQSGVQIFVQ